MKTFGYSLRGVAPVFLATFIFSPAIANAATTCESISALKLPNTIITTAVLVPAGAFTPPAAGRGGAAAAPAAGLPPNAAAGARGGGRGAGGAAPAVAAPVAADAPAGRGGAPAAGGRGNAYANLPLFCRVAATLQPSGDSDIKIEVWLPVNGWNNKLLATGNGAWAGSISYTDLAASVTDGYVGVSTDTGHTGGNAETFAIGHPEKVIDFSYRAVHEMTVTAKALSNAFYGNSPKLSYFQGCSTGGRQALTAAQRYPLDFDGIVAGANAANAARLHATQIWVSQQANRSETSSIPNAKYAVLHDAVLKACDANDGVVDRVIENPRTCKFDPAVLLCKAGDQPSCLTADQVETAKRIYAGPGVWPGYELGSEAGWNGILARPVGIAYDMYRLFLFNDPKWDYKTLDIKKDIPAFEKSAMGPVMNSKDTNLKPFFDHGGKLLMYHGWADPGILPGNSINYYNDVVKNVGASKASNEVRLFMVPGMGHCGGGDGPNNFDKVGTLDAWRETGKAPAQIIASRPASATTPARTRPLCPYPQVANYKGSGSTDDAANFTCKAP